MMKKTLYGIMALGFAVIAGLSGCGDEEVDVSGPQIEMAEPAMNEFVDAGSAVHFMAEFKDNIELKTYNIEIHDDFDRHSHGRIAAVQADPSLLKWYFEESFDIPEGSREYSVHLESEIVVAENALAGPYHFIVQAIDASGNATSFDDDSNVEVTIFITNNSMPQATITNLEDGELHIAVNQMFMVEGNITDATTGTYAGMHALDIILGEENGDHDHSQGGRLAEEDLIDVTFEEGDLEQFMEGGQIILQKVFESINFKLSQAQLDELTAENVEHLDLKIMAHDEQGNIGISITPVHFD
ncbi:MAG: DUF4625 domain-containing protein [Cyclobacteriaceae bacterium]|nr:DUF4625 domain-containing protein [Cyclobacteriaceae bacterium]